MKKIIVLISMLVALNGCIPVLIGAGVVTGYAVSSDAAIGNVKMDYRGLWDVCLAKLENLEAEIVQSDQSKGLIKARIGEYNISVKINNINLDTQRLKVSARRTFMPKPQYAQKVFLKIIEDF
jgi:uncharacterized protein DUF3568